MPRGNPQAFVFLKPQAKKGFQIPHTKFVFGDYANVLTPRTRIFVVSTFRLFLHKKWKFTLKPQTFMFGK